jgi:hypothetical protein
MFDDPPGSESTGSAVSTRSARMTAAVLSTPAMAPREFRLPEVWIAASLGQLAQLVLVTPAERLALRLHVLALSLRLSLRSMRHEAAGPRWRRFERALSDWCVLDRAHVSVSYARRSALPVDVPVGGTRSLAV